MGERWRQLCSLVYTRSCANNHVFIRIAVTSNLLDPPAAEYVHCSLKFVAAISRARSATHSAVFACISK